MKLDIEALAREAGFVTGSRDMMTGLESLRFIKPLGTDNCKTELERFARLIVERCAVECNNLILPDNIRAGTEPNSAWESGALDCSDAIRQLLEDK
jgi:hypothetical protein